MQGRFLQRAVVLAAQDFDLPVSLAEKEVGRVVAELVPARNKAASCLGIARVDAGSGHNGPAFHFRDAMQRCIAGIKSSTSRALSNKAAAP